MKTVKHLSVLLAVLLMVSIAVVGFVVSADDPAVITVTNEEEFAAAMVEANAAATIELANDITLTNGNTTMPGTFTGKFDGKGFTLSGITNTLFNKLSGATVKDVVVEGAITSDNRKAATIAYDEENNSFIQNVTSYVDITMSASDLNAGGIIGYGKSVTFENVTYAGDYVATWNGAGAGIGGIIGYTNNNGTANYINCAFTGTMTVNGEATGTLDLGAIIGIARNGENNFENCVNGGTFTVTAPATTFNVSAVVGRNRDNSATISVKNCLNYGTASEGITVAGVVASGEVATNEGNVTAIPVANADELSATMVEANINAYIILTADIDMTGKEWAPIKVFKGTFDGNGHVISGIHIEQAFESDGYGFGLLIRDLDQGVATVKNLTLKDCSLTLTADQTGNRNNHIGGVVGWAGKGHFENIHLKNVDVSFTGNTKGQCNVGGIVGMSNSANPATGTISFYNCSVDADSSVKGDTSRAPNVGGIVGNLTGDIQAPAGGYKLDMQNCVNYASVSSNDWAGGMIGSLYSTGENTIVNCKNYGTITGVEAASLVCSAGGKSLTVKNSVAGGLVLYTKNGGAVSAVNNNAVTVENTEESAVVATGVATADEFRAAIAANKGNILLLADIDLGETGNVTLEDTFSGIFDGQGYTVSGITNTLFKQLTGTVKNVTLNGAIVVDGTAEGADNGELRKTATVARDARDGAVVENVVSNVDITLTSFNINAGGIVGYAKAVTMKNVTYAGNLIVNWTGNDAGIGGIVGWSSIGGSDTSEYIDCVFTGSITVNETAGSGTMGSISAILGLAKGGKHVISRAINAGELAVNTGGAGYNWFGGIVACFENATDSTITGSVVAPKNVLVNGNPNTQRQFYAKANGCTVTGSGAFNMADGSWITNDGEAFATVLATMAADATVKLAADVTLPEGTPTVNIEFAGTLDGQGKTVSGLSNPLFKKIVGGTVKNVTFEGNVDFTDESVDNKTIRRYATTIALEAKNVTLENVTSNVNITVIGTDLNAGGLIGYANEAQLTNCTYGGTYTATGDGAVGAMIGYVRTNSGTNTYTNCAFTGTINFDGVEEGKTVYIGGLVGKHRQHTVNVVDASVTGTFNVTNNAGNVYVGGFIGTDNDVATLTMSGVFDGIINAEGATVDPFLADDAGSPADLSGCKAKVNFDEGTITLDKDGAFLLGTDSYSAFLSVRDGATEGTQDYRFVIVADGETYKAGSDVKLVLTFTKDGATVKTLTKTFAELELFAKATAAGNVYVAAEGCFLTGLVVTGVPADAWDTVSVAVVDGETKLAEGEVANADISEEAVYTITENSIEFYSTNGVDSIAIETHHESHNYNPTFVICLWGDDTVAAIYQDIYNKGFNPNYTWYMSVNGGAEFIPASFSCHDGETWGYLRAELGAAYADAKSYDITLVIVDNATQEAVYYGDFYIHNDFVFDENKPENITVVAPEDITVKGGPDIGGGEGADKAFDGKHDTKVCTGNVGADNALIVELKNTISLKGVGICNANDNEGNTGRTVLDFEIYVSADGENWGEPVYVATGEGKNKEDYKTNFMEMYYDFDSAVSAKFVKIVVNNDGLYQISDVLLYASTGTFMPENHLNFYFEQSNQDGSKNLVYWFHDNFGGVDTVAKIAAGEYILDLVIDGVEYKNVSTTSAAGRYLLINIETLGVKGIKAGNYYDCSLTVRDTAGNRVYYNDPFSAGNYQRKEGCPYDLVPPAALEVSDYGIENHHADLDYRCAWVINTGDLKLCPAITDGTYTVALMINGVKTPITTFSLYGDNWVRMDLETAGVTGIVRGTKFNLQAIIYDADGYAVYETQVFEVTSNVFSSDVATQNVTLPTTGIKEVTVDTSTLSVKNGAGEDQGFWGDGPVANLFDGNTAQTKMGCGTDGTVALTFSLTDPATLSYYTLWTGNDTGNQDRNPKTWVLYGKVGEEWVVLSAVGFDAPSGMQGKPSTPNNYAITNPVECKEYKIVFETNGSFQLNELYLYTNVEGAGITAAAAIGTAEVLPYNSHYGFNTTTQKIGYGIQSRGHYNGAEGLAEINIDNAYCYIRAQGGEFVRYTVTSMTTEAHYKAFFTVEGFVPEAGVKYDYVVICTGGASWKYPGAAHAFYATGLVLVNA
ncbi:MAG: discoidin domain-containing protein [Clostridia bacterium]|nr:discoidin domain-containing protein [Clostridia bacterium]